MENRGIAAAVGYLTNINPHRFVLSTVVAKGSDEYERILTDCNIPLNYYLDRANQLDPNSELCR